MNRDSAQILSDITTRIVEAVDPETILLFGSWARGDARADSDVDLIVVEAEPFGADRSRLRELARVGRALRRVNVPADILLYSRQEMERWRNSPNHPIGRALREGRVLYERP
jgi:predicted nucleotidyltransferase